MNNRFAAPALAFLALAVLATCGYWWLFTHFMAYDDEGYVLWSVRQYLNGGALYTDVYSQYGPLPYVLAHAISFFTGGAWDHTMVRIIALGYWLACTVLAGWFTWRETKHLLATATSSALVFCGLIAMANEPGHPGGLLALLAAAVAYGGAALAANGRVGRLAGLTAALAAAAMLGKINVGLFLVIAIGAWMLLHTFSHGDFRRAIVWIIALGCAVAPLLLMRQLYHERWVAIFAFVFATSALSLLPVLHRTVSPLFGRREWMLAPLAGAATLIGVVGLTITHGTIERDLVNGLLWEPLRHPFVYSHPARWPAGMPWLTLGAAGLAVLYFSRPNTRGLSTGIALARLVATSALVLAATRTAQYTFIDFGFIHGAPWVWLMVVPLAPTQDKRSTTARAWVAWVFLWQLLQAYPVAGSQTAWAGFLGLPLAVIGVHDAIRFLTTSQSSQRSAQLATVMHGVLLLGASAGVGQCLTLGYQRYMLVSPLGLRGAADLRLQDDVALTLRLLSRNCAAHANMLFSFPGLFSFNVWSDRPTPTQANVTHWFSLLSTAQQQAIVARLDADPRAVLIVQRYLIDYLVQHGQGPRGPLCDYLAQEFVPALRFDTYELHVHRGRTIAPLGTAKLVATSAGLTELELVTDTEAPVTRVELHTLWSSQPLQTIKVGPAVGTRTLISADASVLTDPEAQPMSRDRARFNRLRVPIPPAIDRWPSTEILCVKLYDARGYWLDTLRFAP